MKKLLTALGVLAVLAIPTQSFAWTYEGLNSLNPFTGFRQCNKCEKVDKCACKKQKLTKCEKLNGVKVQRGTVCGCAAPIQYENPCPTCRRAF